MRNGRAHHLRLADLLLVVGHRGHIEADAAASSA